MAIPFKLVYCLMPICLDLVVLCPDLISHGTFWCLFFSLWFSKTGEKIKPEEKKTGEKIKPGGLVIDFLGSLED